MNRIRRSFMLGIAASGAALLALGMPAQAQSVSYTYDALGRLSTVTYPGGVVTSYTYDAANNRTQVTTGTPPPPPTLTASANPTTVNGSASTDAPPALCTAAGGVPPYTYLWDRVSGNGNTEAFTPASASSGGWYYTGTLLGPTKISYWRCRVTDAASTVVYTGQVTVRIAMN